MKVLFVGMGGTNTQAAQPLLRYLNTLNPKIEEVIIIDGDKFDSDNRTRQDFEPNHISVNKAEAKASELQNKFPELLITSIPEYLHEDDISYYITDNVIVMLAVDCMKTRKLVDNHAKTLKNILIVSMGNEMTDGDAFFYCKVNGKEISPSIQIGHPEISRATQLTRSEMTCEEIAAMPSGGQLIFANLQSGGIGATIVWKVLTETKMLTEPANLEYRGAYFDINTMRMRPVPINQ